MLLRSRLTLFLSLAFVVLVVALVLAGAERERLLDQRYASVVISGQRSLWNQLVAAEAERLAPVAAGMAGDALLAQALASGDGPALRSRAAELAAPLVAAGLADEVELVGVDMAVRYSSAAAVEERAMIDVGTFDQVLQGGGARAGLVQDRPDRFMVVRAEPVGANGRRLAVLVLAAAADRVLWSFARSLGASSFLVSLRGRPVEGTEPALAGVIPATVPTREPSFVVAEGAERLFTVTGVPIRDLAGAEAGALVTLRDATLPLREAERLGRNAAIFIAVFVGVVLALLYWYLKHSFRPLEQAISVLRALSRGDTGVSLEAEGRGEIGRIADAVRLFRVTTMSLVEQRRQRERQRRRQERLIRRQMESLAATLESEGREAVMGDLQAIVARQPAPGPAEGREDEQLGLLAVVLQRMSARIADQHARLQELIAELREAIVTRAKLAGLQQELEIAREVQRAILPHRPPPMAELEIDGRMVPAKEVGGDFYDFFELDGGRMGVVVADVSGKGVPAAIFMAITRTLLKATALFTPSPAACVARVNQLLAAENEQLLFVTLFYGVLERASGRLTFANAGHNRPFRIARDGAVRQLEGTGGVALAIMEELQFHEATAQLAPGEALFLFTDGVTEATDLAGAEFGEAQLAALLGSSASGLAAGALAERVVEAVNRFAEGAPQADDITCVALRWFGSAEVARPAGPETAAAVPVLGR